MRRIILLLVFIVSYSFCYTQQKNLQNNLPSKPKLVIGIVVDQMRYDYIERYWNKFRDGGFKRLVNEGTLFKNCHYNYAPTETAPGHASIYTGTTPSVHGIVANDWFNIESLKTVSSVYDENNKIAGNGKTPGASPLKLLTSTVTDQFHKYFGAQSKVISISLKDRAAILPGGKDATAAYWYDDSTGNWISSTYYFKNSVLPKWVTMFNSNNYPDNYLSKGWSKTHENNFYENADSSNYENLLGRNTSPVFPYLLKPKNYYSIKYTAWGNTLTAKFAMNAITNEQLGQRKISDFLCISFSSTDYVGHQFGINSVEVEETYLQLDSMLEQLLMQIDKKVGKNNVLLFLTADHGAVSNPQYLIDKGESGGFIQYGNVRTRLRNFLGDSSEDSLLLDASGYQVYLNHQLMAKRNMNEDSLSDAVAEFLMQQEGIAIALTSKELKRNKYTSGIKQIMQNGFNESRCGDVEFVLKPNWIIWRAKKGTTHGTPYEYDTHVPLIFYGWKIKNNKSETDVKITDITPTVSTLLGIELPRGCTGKAIKELIK